MKTDSVLLKMTDRLDLGEDAIALTELIAPVEGQQHRVRNIWVVRDDEPAVYIQDLGLANEHQVEEFNIVGGFVERNRQGKIVHFEPVHTVSECLFFADQMRIRNDWQITDYEPLNLINEYHDEIDKLALTKSGEAGRKMISASKG